MIFQGLYEKTFQQHCVMRLYTGGQLKFSLPDMGNKTAIRSQFSTMAFLNMSMRPLCPSFRWLVFIRDGHLEFQKEVSSLKDRGSLTCWHRLKTWACFCVFLFEELENKIYQYSWSESSILKSCVLRNFKQNLQRAYLQKTVIYLPLKGKFTQKLNFCHE